MPKVRGKKGNHESFFKKISEAGRTPATYLGGGELSNFKNRSVSNPLGGPGTAGMDYPLAGGGGGLASRTNLLLHTQGGDKQTVFITATRAHLCE